VPTKVIPYLDAVVTIHAPIFGGAPTVDVLCRTYQVKGLTLDQFAALIYPSIDAKAKEAQ
jgi:hypothetical protein